MGQSRFAQEVQGQGQGQGQDQGLQQPLAAFQQQQEQPAVAAPAAWQQQAGGQQQQHQRPRPSGLVDDGSLWASTGDTGRGDGGGRHETERRHPLEGDAGPFHHEQAEVSWDDDVGGGEEEEEAALLSSPPHEAPSALPPGAIM